MKHALNILVALFLSIAAYADEGWVIRAEGECPDYTGAAAANGTMPSRRSVIFA